MPTSRETSLKCGTEAVCALATRGKIRASDRICRITMSVQIIEQRKLINHAGQKGFQPQRHRGAQREPNRSIASASSVVGKPVRVEYRFSCLDRHTGRE